MLTSHINEIFPLKISVLIEDYFNEVLGQSYKFVDW